MFDHLRVKGFARGVATQCRIGIIPDATCGEIGQRLCRKFLLLATEESDPYIRHVQTISVSREVPYKIEFQYMAPGASRPEDAVQEEELVFDDNTFMAIPDVGDTVMCTLSADGNAADFKVLSRHFSYLKDTGSGPWCIVNIVVSDVSPEEMAQRQKM